MLQVGFIGLGIMGKPMALNLLRKGYSVAVHDVSESKVAELVQAGAFPGDCCAEIASRCDIIILMLPDGPDVEVAVLGSEGILEGANPGSVVVDMSSISPVISKKVGAACEVAGLEFLDAPVSGGQPRATDGTLAIMVGGKPHVFARVLPVLEALGSIVTLTGPIGAGNVTKLANQIMVACNIAAMGEALVLAARAGLDPAIVFHAVKGGLAGSNVLNAKAPMVLSRNFQPGFRISMHQKDLRNALSMAESMDVALPLTSLVQQALIALTNQGKGNLDHSAIVMFTERMANLQVANALASV